MRKTPLNIQVLWLNQETASIREGICIRGYKHLWQKTYDRKRWVILKALQGTWKRHMNQHIFCAWPAKYHINYIKAYHELLGVEKENILEFFTSLEFLYPIYKTENCRCQIHWTQSKAYSKSKNFNLFNYTCCFCTVGAIDCYF